MKLVHVDPFNSFDTLTRRFFHDFDRGGRLLNQREFDMPIVSPRTDIRENDTAITLTLELAGMAKEDIAVTVNKDRVLTISGEKKEDVLEEGTTTHRRERRYGSFSRSFTLSETIDTTAIDAQCNNGVLTLTLPKVTPTEKPEVSIVVR